MSERRWAVRWVKVVLTESTGLLLLYKTMIRSSLLRSESDGRAGSSGKHRVPDAVKTVDW